MSENKTPETKTPNCHCDPCECDPCDCGNVEKTSSRPTEASDCVCNPCECDPCNCKTETSCCKKSEKTISVNIRTQKTLSLNPYLSDVPEFFHRYRHPAHRHKLALLTKLRGHRCDNDNCDRNIPATDTIFSCLICDYDLCERCFQLNTEFEVPLSPTDSTIDERTIRPLIVAHNQ